MYNNDKVEYKGYTIRFEQDHSPFDPRVDLDNLGHMVCFHRDYNLGDKHTMSVEELKETIEREDVVSLPCIIYDHSGLGMMTNRNSYPYNCPWDSSHVGYIYVTYEEIEKEYGDTSEESLRMAAKMLENEVNMYDMYLQGDVWGWVVEKDGEHIDSCWGYYGFEECEKEMLREAQGVIDWELGKIEKERKEKEVALDALLGHTVMVEMGTPECLVMPVGVLVKQPTGEYWLDDNGRRIAAVFMVDHVETVDENVIKLKGGVK